MKPYPRSIIAALIVTLAGCGGGSSSTPQSSASSSTPTTQPSASTVNSQSAPAIPSSTTTTPIVVANSPVSDELHTPPASDSPPAVATTVPKPADTPPPQTSKPLIPVVITPPPIQASTTPTASAPVLDPVVTPTIPTTSPGQEAQKFLNAITNPTPPSARQTKDMPDQYADNQIHVVYAVAKGEADRGRDVSNYFTNSIQSWNNWLKVEAGGRKIKFDVYQYNLDITYVAMPRTDKEYSVFGGDKITQITGDISAALGGLKSNKKYLVYFEGGRQYQSDYVSCGDTKLGAQLVVQYLLGDPPGAVCVQGRDFASSGTLEPRYLDYIMIHELVHAEGGVSNSAPNAERNHVNDDERDLMAIRGNFDGWKFLDINKSNYYNLKGLPDGIYNFATSTFLTPPGSVN